MSKPAAEDHGGHPPLPRLILSSGEPAGVGPELCAQVAASRELGCELVCLGDPELMAACARDAEHGNLFAGQESNEPEETNANAE